MRENHTLTGGRSTVRPRVALRCEDGIFEAKRRTEEGGRVRAIYSAMCESGNTLEGLVGGDDDAREGSERRIDVLRRGRRGRRRAEVRDRRRGRREVRRWGVRALQTLRKTMTTRFARFVRLGFYDLNPIEGSKLSVFYYYIRLLL